jgi:hypothetical protein
MPCGRKEADTQMARSKPRITRHSADEYAAWGLQRLAKIPQVYALEVATGKVVFLPEGGKDQPLPGALDQRSIHDRTKAGDFACLISGCGPFAYVSGGTTRHSWVHPTRDSGPRPGHDPETLWHQQVKHHFANWVRERLGSDTITRLHVDDAMIQTAQGPVKPDVLVELVAGHRIAIEIQRSPGDPLRTKAKRQAYAAAGVIDWWIYAPAKKTLQREKKDSRRIRLIESQVQMTELQKPFYWFDLTSNRIATPYSPYARRYTRAEGEDWTGLERTARWSPIRRARFVYLDGDSLDSCSIDQGHLRTRVDREIEDNAARWMRREPALRAKAREQYLRQQHDEQVLQQPAQVDTEAVGAADVPAAAPAVEEELAARPSEQPALTPTTPVDVA